MLSFAFLVTGAQAGIWEAAMSLLNSVTIDMPSASKLHFEQSNNTNSHGCKSSFDFLDMKFTSIELADPNEYFFVSDTTEYVVTRLENSWLLHNVIDDDLLMFGLSGECPENANWYWIHTMERVGDSSADFEPEMTAEIVKNLETENLMNFQNSEGGEVVRELSLARIKERELKENSTDGLSRCKKHMINEPVSITHYILNDFENGIIFNFYENSNIEINILFPLNLSVEKIKGNVSVKEINGQTNIVIMEKGEIRTLVVFDLTESEKRMVQSGLVLKLGTVCLD